MINPMDLSGRNIIVTGASSGIGRETAIQLSRLNANLILIARNEDGLSDTVSMLQGDTHSFYPCDLEDIFQIGDVIRTARSENGPISGLVHSAGMMVNLPLRNLKIEVINKSMILNYVSFMELSKQCTRKGVFNDSGGSIIAVSSIAANISVPGISAYSATKGALNSVVKSLALEYAHRKIRFNCVSPGWVQTEMTAEIDKLLQSENDFKRNVLDKHPLGIGKPVDVALATAFLLSDAARWITGTSLVIDGGYTAH